MVDPHVLSSRLSALEGYLVELRTFRRFPRTEFAREPALHHLAERYLHLACECALDLAHHVIAQLGLRQPTNYRDAMVILAEERLLTEDLSLRMQRWMGFRNVLVHFYVDVDHGRAWDAIGHDLEDLAAYAVALAKLLPTA